MTRSPGDGSGERRRRHGSPLDAASSTLLHARLPADHAWRPPIEQHG